MSYGPELDHLALQWANQPASTCFAPLAEGLRKGGALEAAATIATRGVAACPRYLPGRLVLARILRDQQQWTAAEVELRAALTIDREHPVVQETLRQVLQRREAPRRDASLADGEPTEAEVTELVYSDEVVEEVLPSSHEPVVTESLAMLYWGQGHFQQAIEAFDALIQRQPTNLDLVTRRDAIRAELEASRPMPYDAASSGGRSVRDWLASIAAVTAAPSQPVSGFDAFYQTSAAPAAEPSDLAAFQAWLRELDR